MYDQIINSDYLKNHALKLVFSYYKFDESRKVCLDQEAYFYLNSNLYNLILLCKKMKRIGKDFYLVAVN